MGKNKTEDLLNEFIRGYFSQGELEEFNSDFLRLNDLGQDASVNNSSDDQSEIRGRSYQLNIRIDALITFAEKKLDNHKYLSFLIFLGTFSITNGEMESALGIYNKVLKETAKNKNYTDVQANAYLSIGEIYSRQAKWQDSFRNIKKAASLFKIMRDKKGLARCENLSGTIYGDIGNIPKAKVHFENSLELIKAQNDPSLLGLVEINLGILNMMEENYDLAMQYLKRSLTNFQKTGDYKRIAEIHYNCGMLHLKTDNFDSANNELEKSVALAEDFDYLPLLAISYLSKAQVYLKMNDNSLALMFADKSMGISYRISDRLTVADVYKIKGVIQRNLHNYTAAENYLLTSLRINKELSNKYNYAETSIELGKLYKATGRTREGSAYLAKGRTYYKKIKAFKELQRVDLVTN